MRGSRDGTEYSSGVGGVGMGDRVGVDGAKAGDAGFVAIPPLTRNVKDGARPFQAGLGSERLGWAARPPAGITRLSGFRS